MSIDTNSDQYNMRGVWDLPRLKEEKTEPSTLSAFLHSSVALYDTGCNAGMTDARDTKYTRGQDKSHVFKLMQLLVRRDDLGLTNESDINIQYARGYLSGYTAIISGVIA